MSVAGSLAADEHAESKRERVRTERSADKTLASELAEIEGQRQRVHQVARDEEYVGFTELQEVLASEAIPPIYMERYIPHLKESDVPPSLAQHLTKEEAQPATS